MCCCLTGLLPVLDDAQMTAKAVTNQIVAGHCICSCLIQHDLRCLAQSPRLPALRLASKSLAAHLGWNLVKGVRGQRGKQVHQSQGVVQVSQRIYKSGVPADRKRASGSNM